MGYVVLARKWRPLTFDDVVGQEHITVTLKKAIEMNRIAHAFVFSGTRGVGKTTTARILARALNCEKGPTVNPCGVCESCAAILSGSSFDVLEIDGASNNGVDNIRELRDNIQYASMGGKYRVIVIDEVHMLSKGAFNALLKTLEEPPKNVIFIFATTESHKIPDTILSRCQRYNYRAISAEQIAGRLTYICDQEKITYEKNGLTLIARKADGSMRDGLSLLDQVYSSCPDGITEADVRTVLGVVSSELYNRLVKGIADRDQATALAVVADVVRDGYDLDEFITGLEDFVRSMLFAKIPGVLDNPRIDMPREDGAFLTQCAARFSEGDILRMAQMLRASVKELRFSTFPRFVVELVLLKLVHLDSTVSLEELLTLAGKPGGTAMPPSQTVAPAPIAANSRPAVQSPPEIEKKKLI